MTVVAWDGKTLAADKRATAGTAIQTVTKIRRIGTKLVGAAGDLTSCQAMLRWLAGEEAEFPDSQYDEDTSAEVLVVEKGRVWIYENDPNPIQLEDPFFAIGTGGPYALAAMHCGKSAVEAVEIAGRFDSSCGNGVDALILERGRG